MRRVGVLLWIGFFAACGGSSSDPAPDGNNGGDGGGGDPPVIDGCPITPPADNAGGIKEKCGVFVSSSKGTSDGNGLEATPFASLQKAIDSAKASGKRVYVCAQTYREQITLANDVEMFGYFDCSGPTWKVGTSKAIIDGPASPTVKASGIGRGRLDGFEIRSPDATEPSGSSIAMVAISSPGLKIYNSKIHAGTGAKGTDGVQGVQLTQGEHVNGGPPVFEEDCCQSYHFNPQTDAYECQSTDSRCTDRHRVFRSEGGWGQCDGAPGYSAPRGGAGGIGGHFMATRFAPIHWEGVRGESELLSGLPIQATADTSRGGEPNGNALQGAAQTGASGTDGRNGFDAGSINDQGSYVPSNGMSGTAGKSGQGGGGGGGHDPFNPPDKAGYETYSSTGGGGGAGGCPGLPGTPGTGGGASIGIVSIQSPIQLVASIVETSSGGSAGKGTNGSAPTPGGEPGVRAASPSINGAHGGAGGRAGVSGSGGGGPSIGIAIKGGAPILTNSEVNLGPGGPGALQLDMQGRNTVPPSPNGISIRTRDL